MCESCQNIQTWKKFDTPKDDFSCIAYIWQLVLEGGFELIQKESTCPLEKVSVENEWPDDIILTPFAVNIAGRFSLAWSTLIAAAGNSKKGKDDRMALTAQISINHQNVDR